jgi:predicted metal-binding protein
MSRAVRRTPASDRRQSPELEKYVALAKRLKMVDALIISPSEICFDIRALLKCRWGCDDSFQGTVRCHDGGTTLAERMEMVKSYGNVLLAHSHDARDVSKAVLEIEREAYLNGLYFAFAVRSCNLCRACKVKKGGTCPTPESVRPCEGQFGIDVFKTVRRLGLPCEPLRNKDDVQNRYGFVLLD